MSDDFETLPVVHVPTAYLRFVLRDGKKILQQAWKDPDEKGVLWCDVQLVTEGIRGMDNVGVTNDGETVSPYQR